MEPVTTGQEVNSAPTQDGVDSVLNIGHHIEEGHPANPVNPASPVNPAKRRGRPPKSQVVDANPAVPLGAVAPVDTTESFRLFRKGGKTISAVPDAYVGINDLGRITLNRHAVEMAVGKGGDVEALRLYHNEARDAIILVPAQKGDPDAYAVNKHNSRSYNQIVCTAFVKELGLDTAHQTARYGVSVSREIPVSRRGEQPKSVEGVAYLRVSLKRDNHIGTASPNPDLKSRIEQRRQQREQREQRKAS